MASAQELMAWYGTSEALPEARQLTAGSLSVEFVGGNLRTIRYDGVEVIRAIAYVVRDKDWGTLDIAIEDLSIAQHSEAFRISYRGSCEATDGAELKFDATIEGSHGAGLRFEVVAIPRGDFQTNRCGFCILHPIVGVAGSAVTVEHTDGSSRQAFMPDRIEPWQPFKAMRSITHEVCPGLIAVCRMEGDDFEMEDQRNWSDASYKTYVRPLERPWPYLLPAGQENRQSVALHFEGTPASPSVLSSADEVTIAFGETMGEMPMLGLCLAPEEAEAALAHADSLRRLAPQLLICHFDPTAGHGRAELARHAAIAGLIEAEVSLECVVPGVESPRDELTATASLVVESGLRLDSIAVSPSVDRQSTPPGSTWPPCPPLADIYEAARAAFPAISLGGGMFSYFTELNRKRPPVHMLDFVTHCTNPIVHAADDLSVMQTLEALPFITRTARAIIGKNKAYRIGPSTIAMRQNPYGSRTMDNPDARRIAMANIDPRQDGLFAAAWTLGYAARVADAGLEALTPGALTGPFGCIDEAGRARPVAAVFEILASAAGAPRVACVIDAPEKIQAIAVRRAQGIEAWAANLTPISQKARIAGETGRLKLGPYAVERIV